MKTLSSALQTALGAPVQRPAVLVEIAFSTVWRGTTGAAITWSGQSWPARDMSMAGLRVDALAVNGSVVIGNTDDAMAALLLNEGIADRPVKIWGYDAAATATADVVLLSGDSVGASFVLTEREARIDLRHRAELVVGPRTWLTPENFGPMLPAGATLRINGVDYTLSRD
jgi:hypothetical protein